MKYSARADSKDNSLLDTGTCSIGHCHNNARHREVSALMMRISTTFINTAVLSCRVICST